jgi:hypothetical protein
MQKKSPVIGDLVICKFLDHAENSSDVLLFEVIGRLFDVTKKAYKIKSWGYVNEIDRAGDGNPDNENHYAIVKRAVESIQILK